MRLLLTALPTIRLLYVSVCLLASCGHHTSQQDQSTDLSDIKARRDAYVKEFNPTDITRCDRITFLALMESVTNGKESLAYEKPELKGMIEKISGQASLAESADAIGGFQGHLLASYIWLDARISGQVSGIELDALNVLTSQTPQSPFFSALYHRFSDGNQDGTLELMRSWNTPYSNFWGSAPDSVMFTVTTAILEGK